MLGLTVYAPFLGILGLVIAYLIFMYVKKQPNGNETMQNLEEMIHDGAMAFLKKEYSYLIVFIGVVFVALLIGLNWQTAIAFITGAGCSILAGYLGMSAATRGNSRTAKRSGPNQIRPGRGPERVVFFRRGYGAGRGVPGPVGRRRLVLYLWRDAGNVRLH